MFDANKKIVEKIADLITCTPNLQSKLHAPCIVWSSQFVKIHDTLLDAPPLHIEKTATGGYRRLSKDEYDQVLKKWQEKNVGGHAEVNNTRTQRSWYPPSGSVLYGLYCAMSASTKKQESPDYRYYLLGAKGKNFFLKKTTGKENSLVIISQEKVDPVITTTLESVLKELQKTSAV